jgi:tetratricopeptide (TPR) repeat protein
VAIAVDAYNRLYVVSSTTYQGVIVMTDEGEFTGFIGAQAVQMSAWEIIWRRFQTQEQRAASVQKVCTEFNNISINKNKGLVYVTTSTIDEGAVQGAITGKDKSGTNSPVKLLNANGTEIMRRNGFWMPAGEIDFDTRSTADISGVSTIIDAAVGPENTWSIIDSKRNRIYTYDFDGNLLFAFGDKGDQMGNLQNIAAVTYQGDRMLLLDMGESKSFTAFSRTDYGNILMQALDHQNARQYDKAIDDWTEILKRNSNFDAAYVGIGKALYRSGEYEESLEYYKSAYDTVNYSLSYKEIRKEWIGNFIIFIPIGIGVLCFFISKFLKYANKINRAAALKTEKKSFKEELLYVFHVMFHPFDGFWDLKHEKRGSVRAGIVFIVITIVAYFYKAIGQGYMVDQQQGTSSIMTWVISVLVTVFLWAISNWCLTTLFDGEGSFKDIFIATSYCLLPVPFTVIPCTLISNFVIDTEVSMLSFVETLGIIYMLILVFIGMMVTHDYTMGKNIITSLGTIVAMVFIMFVAALFSTLLIKIVSFVSNIVIELRYRM